MSISDEKLSRLYQRLYGEAGPYSGQAFVVVSMKPEDLLKNGQAHTQPGTMFPYWISELTAPFHSTLQSNEPLPQEPTVKVLFTVSNPDTSRLTYNFDAIDVDPLLNAPYKGTLSLSKLTDIKITISPDILHTSNLFGDVFACIRPNGQIMYDEALQTVASRMHAIQTLNRILANTDPSVAAEALKMLSRDTRHWETDHTAQALRDTLQATPYRGEYVFTENEMNCVSFHGLMYANPLGMDLAMRTTQAVLQQMVPQLDVMAVAKLDSFFDALGLHNEISYSQATPEKVVAALSETLETFKSSIDDRFHTAIDNVISELPQHVHRAEVAMADPTATLLRQACENYYTETTFPDSGLVAATLTYNLRKALRNSNDSLADCIHAAAVLTAADFPDPHQASNNDISQDGIDETDVGEID